MGQINTNNYPTVNNLSDTDLLIVENATNGTGTTTPKQLRENAIGTGTLQTSAQTVTGAINELKHEIDAGAGVVCYDVDTITSGYLGGQFSGSANLLLLHLTTDGTADATNGYMMMLSYSRPVARFAIGRLVDADGVAYKQDVYADNTIICTISGSGEGTESDPVQVVILGVINAGFMLTPTAVVSDRDIQDGQGNTLSVLAEALTKTASGNPVVITDCAGGKARSLTTSINAIQDLHGLPFPYVGGAYKNKLDSSAVTQGSFDDSSATANCVSDYTPISGGADYYMSGNSGYADGIYLRFYDANKTELDTSTRISKYVVAFGFTAPSTAVYTRIMWYKGGGLTPTNVANALVQLEIGTTATSFAPYSNICPISGRDRVAADDTGRNIWDEVWEVGAINDTTGEIVSGNRISSSHYIKVSHGVEYYITFPDRLADDIKLYYYDKDYNYLGTSTWLRRGTVTFADNVAYFRFNMATAYGLTYGNDICINISDASFNGQYAPYQHSSATIQLGQTVYGADINWDTGVMTVKTAKIDLGSLDYLTATVGGVTFYYADVPNAPQRDYTAICSNYPVTNNQTEFFANDGIARAYGTTSYGGFARVSIIDSRYNGYTTTQFKEAMSGVDYEYELATPIELTLTPTEVQMLKGYNRVTIDNGSIELGYIAKLT